MRSIKFTIPKFLKQKKYAVPAIFFLTLFLSGSAYAWYLDGRILHHTFIGDISVGGLTREEAAVRLDEAINSYGRDGIRLVIEGATQVIHPDTIGVDLNLAQAVDAAFARGHEGGFFRQTGQRLAALWGSVRLDAPVRFDEQALDAQIQGVAQAVGSDRRDLRLSVRGTRVTVLTDTKPGRVIDLSVAKASMLGAMKRLDASPVTLELVDDPPRADPATADAARRTAEKMISRSLALSYEDAQFYISREKIGTWIISIYDGNALEAGLDLAKIGAYVANVAKALNVDPEPASITTSAGRVTGFKPPRVGRAVKEDVLVQMIRDTVIARTAKDRAGDSLVVPLETTKLAVSGLDSAAGISELVGRATTPFTGSPKNRILNIKNGVKFLSGVIVGPGEEFSTLRTLGTIDDTTGYLPELVIKGDRTTPEFGGGLCQVSTTLFRAVMDAGLPITARRNHSFRVPYYEKDGNGKIIGPGLDATIYEPDVDFKFLNDTSNPILIIGYVIGDKLTFELYGTRDGRTSKIDGPKLLNETPSGEPVYIETDTLPPGQKKQVETPHPGGATVATYTITYADGRKVKKEFRSYYRPWPAKYLVGVAQISDPLLDTVAPQ